MNEENENNLKRIVMYVMGISTGYLICDAMNNHALKTTNIIPNTDLISVGYVNPNKLSIKLEDLDADGKPETIMQYNNKRYLLLENNGNPQIMEYSLTPSKIEYKK